MGMGKMLSQRSEWGSQHRGQDRRGGQKQRGQGITIEAGTNLHGESLINELPHRVRGKPDGGQSHGAGACGVRGVLPGPKSLLPSERISPHIPRLGYSGCPAADKWVYFPSPSIQSKLCWAVFTLVGVVDFFWLLFTDHTKVWLICLLLRPSGLKLP